MKKKFLALPLLGVMFFALPLHAQEDPTPEEDNTQTQEEECPNYTEVKTDEVMKASGAVNIRSTPCLEDNIVGSLGVGDEVRVVAARGNWMEIEVDGEVIGWVSGEYLQNPNQIDESDSEKQITEPKDEACSQEEVMDLENPMEMKVKEEVNLRDGACTTGTQVFTVLPPGEIVTAVKKQGNWYNIQRANGTAGWVYGQLLTEDLNYQPLKEEEGELPFNDIADTLYQDSIVALYKQEILKGNPDGSYGTYDSINRAAFTVVIIRALLDGEENIPDDFETGCFPDVPSYQWYTKAICYAKDKDIIAGHPDGYFRPGDNIDLAAASKILVETFELKKRELKEEQAWFEGYVQDMSDLGAVPPTLSGPEEKVKRQDMAMMIDVILNETTFKTTTRFSYFGEEPIETEVEANEEESSSEETMPSKEEEVDMEVSLNDPAPETEDLKECLANTTIDLNINYSSIAKSVLNNINAARVENDLEKLALSDALNATAMEWALKGELEHSRGELTFDEYQSEIGLKSYVGFSERLTQHNLDCEGAECTGADVIQKAQEVHQLWIEQENNPDGQADDFDALMNPDYNEFGFGFSIEGNSLLLVYHFSKDVVGDEEKLCEILD